MKSTPAVSVLMPVYNAERFLALAVDSVLAQTFGDFELIVVNDGSTDGSKALLDEYARRDSRVRVISRENTGIVGALNDAFAEARASLLARMDGDDVSLPDRLRAQVEFMRTHADCSLLGTEVCCIDEEGLRILQPQHLCDHDAIEAQMLNGDGGAIVHPSVMMRREAVERVGAYRFIHQWAEDLDLFLRLAEVGRVANVPEVLFHYRMHSHSVNHHRHSEQGRAVEAVLRDAHSRRGHPLPAEWSYKHYAHAPPEKLFEVYGWGALELGERRAARKYAIRRLRARPLTFNSWKLAYCALRGY
jgi:glycosyltransferase involved in cell wall biosynthesis